MKFKASLYNSQQGYKQVLEGWMWAKSMLMAGHKLKMTIEQETRSIEQNAVMWTRLSDISRQVNWYGKKLTDEDWKHVFSSSMRKLDVVPNLDGTGFVALGQSTSKMTRSEFQEMNDLILAFGSQKNVQWSVASLCGEPE
ncbi:MAG: recombination protein NinB [Pseudomonadota bacterium]|nr:recombination protein NinB [Pseudomonadota bacterium]